MKGRAFFPALLLVFLLFPSCVKRPSLETLPSPKEEEPLLVPPAQQEDSYVQEERSVGASTAAPDSQRGESRLFSSPSLLSEKTSPLFYQEGVASWYGHDFHGKRTSSGERYDMDALTAAHPTLPLGTQVEVVNLENGKAVKVTVNDRGPFKKGRIVDLSREAAKRLDMIGPGTAKVAVKAFSLPGEGRVLGTPPPSVLPERVDARILYRLQVGAFSVREYAMERLEKLKGLFPEDPFQMVVEGPYFKIVAESPQETLLNDLKRRLASKGYGSYIRSRFAQE